jgi:hypothetical protein
MAPKTKLAGPRLVGAKLKRLEAGHAGVIVGPRQGALLHEALDGKRARNAQEHGRLGVVKALGGEVGQEIAEEINGLQRQGQELDCFGAEGAHGESFVSVEREME